MLSEDVALLDTIDFDNGRSSADYGEAWERIKNFIEEAQATDSQQLQADICPNCAGRKLVQELGPFRICNSCNGTGKRSAV